MLICCDASLTLTESSEIEAFGDVISVE